MLAVMLVVLLLYYYYDNYKKLPCLPCNYYAITTKTTTPCHACRATSAACFTNTTTLCHARCAITTLLVRQLQHAAVLAVLLLHYYYDNYNTLPCTLCKYYTTTKTITTRFCAHCATNTLPLRQLLLVFVPARCRSRRATTTLLFRTTTTRRRAHRATTTLLLRQLQHAAVHTVQILHYYYDNYKTLSCPPCYYYSTNYDNYNSLLCPLCYYYTTTTTTATRRLARCASTILLLRQLQHAAVQALLLIHGSYGQL